MARAEADLRKLDVRHALLDAGIAMFLNGGFAAASVGEIVTRAGVPKGSFYYYFDSKDALARDSIDRYVAFDGVRRERLVHGPGGALARLQGYFADHAAAFEKADFQGGCLVGILGLELGSAGSPVAARIRAAMDDWAAVLASVVAEAQAAGEIRATGPAMTLARVLIGAWEGALLRMRIERNAEALREFQTIILQSVLQPV